MTRKQYTNMINKLKKETGVNEWQAKKWLISKIHNDKKRKPEKPQKKTLTTYI